MLGKSIKKYIESILKNKKLTRKEFAEKVGITYGSVNQLIAGNKPNPSLETTLKIANCFQSSLDEILGISKKKNKVSVTIQPQEAINNLYIYINKRIAQDAIRPMSLARNAELAPGAISGFIKTNPRKKSIGTNIITKLAKYWEVSVDEMIGRVERKIDKTTEPTKDKPKSFVEKLRQQRANTSKLRSR